MSTHDGCSGKNWFIKTMLRRNSHQLKDSSYRCSLHHLQQLSDQGSCWRAYDVTSADGEQKIGVRRQTKHPQYNSNTQDNDFAVIELSTRPDKFSDSIMPICLPNVVTTESQIQQDGERLPLAALQHQEHLMKLTWTPSPTLPAPPTPSTAQGRSPSNMICAREDGKDACQGMKCFILNSKL